MEELYDYIKGLAADIRLLGCLWIAYLIVWLEMRHGPRPSGGRKDLTSLK